MIFPAKASSYTDSVSIPFSLLHSTIIHGGSGMLVCCEVKKLWSYF